MMNTSKVKQTGVGEITIQGVNPPTKNHSKIIIKAYSVASYVTQQLFIYYNNDWNLRGLRFKDFDNVEQAVCFANRCKKKYVTELLPNGQVTETY